MQIAFSVKIKNKVVYSFSEYYISTKNFGINLLKNISNVSINFYIFGMTNYVVNIDFYTLLLLIFLNNIYVGLNYNLPHLVSIPFRSYEVAQLFF